MLIWCRASAYWNRLRQQQVMFPSYFFPEKLFHWRHLGCIYHIIQTFLALSLLSPWTHIVESCYLMYTSNTWQTPWTRGLGFWAGKPWIWACAVIPAPWDWHWPALPQALSIILLDTPFLGLSQLDIHVSELWPTEYEWQRCPPLPGLACNLPCLIPIALSLFQFDASDQGDLVNHMLGMAQPGSRRGQFLWITTCRRATCHSGTSFWTWASKKLIYLDHSNWDLGVNMLAQIAFL